jgi:CheY-like chemotaxis protein
MKTEVATKSVLVVEDEQSIRDILVELFEVEGNLVTSAELLPEALDKLRTQRFSAHLSIAAKLLLINLSGIRQSWLSAMQLLASCKMELIEA